MKKFLAIVFALVFALAVHCVRCARLRVDYRPELVWGFRRRDFGARNRRVRGDADLYAAVQKNARKIRRRAFVYP